MMKNKTQLLYLAMSAASLGMGILFSTVLARLLGAELYGRFAVLLHVGFLVAPLNALVPNLIFSSVHSHVKDAESLPDFGPFFLIISILSFPVAFMALSVFPIAVGASAGQRFLALITLYTGVFVLIHQCYYQIRSKYERYLGQQVFVTALKTGLAVLVFLSVMEFTVEWALTVQLVAAAFWFAWSGFDLRRKSLFSGRHLSFENAKLSFSRGIRGSRSLFFPSLSLTLWSMLIYSLDVLMAQRVFNASDLSVYAVLAGISKVTLFLPGVITPLILERGYAQRTEGEIPAGAMLKSVALTLVAGFAVSLVGHLLAPYLIPLLFGRDFVFRGWAIPLLTLGMSLLALLSFFVHYQFGRGRRSALFLSVVGMTLTIGFSFVLPKNLSLNQYCAFIFSWPVLSWLLILVRDALARAAAR